MQTDHRLLGTCAAVGAAGLVLAAALAAIAPALADEWPTLRQGMWDITRTMQPPGGGAPKTVTAQRCMEPAADWQRQNAQLAKAGCTFTPVVRSGSAYTFSSTCNVMGVSSSSKTTIVVESDSAYTLTVDGTTDGEPTHEVMKAKRVADCAK
ncbi:MAG: DUF3617 domain-containing protein [Acidobacteria bacterium]|jgi:hypothetical protein|nr:DUF3617 domain-containing protein [Acidobacteriota bacterium]